jgi:hypothetical protein
VVTPKRGGLEGCKPSKNHYFLVVVAGFAGNHHQKNRDLGEAGYRLGAPPNPSTA